MKRGQEKGAGFESREPTLEDALVTHDGLHGHTPRKRCISTPTRRKTWRRRLGGAVKGLTDVSLCHVCYLHYSDIIIPAPLYLTAPSLFCSETTRIRCTGRDRDAEFCFIGPVFIIFPSSLMLFFLFRRSLVPFACCTRRRRTHVKLGRRRTPLIASI